MHMHFHNDEHGNGLSERMLSRLKYAALITIGYVLFELAAGVYSNSLSVFTDSAQNFIDAVALVLVWWTQRIAARPADRLRTFGYHRATILAALFNAAIMVPVVIEIGSRAVVRFMHPAAVDGAVLGITGFVGLIVNLSVVFLLRDNSNELHVRGAYLHNLADALASVALMVSGIVIAYTGAAWVDLLLAGIICGVITYTLVPIVRKSVHILLEGSPEGIDPEQVARSIREFDEVLQVHDLHTWMHGDGMPAITCHLFVRNSVPHDRDHVLVDNVRRMLRDKFEVTHSTIQIEHVKCEQNQRCVWRAPKDTEHELYHDTQEHGAHEDAAAHDRQPCCQHQGENKAKCSGHGH
jgi:cobalt-zinc-cadmium efflux system protein